MKIKIWENSQPEITPNVGIMQITSVFGPFHIIYSKLIAKR